MAPGVDTKSETSCTANDITRQVDKHVFGKDVRRMSDHSPFGRKSTLLGISRALAVVLSRMNFRMRCPVLKVSLPEVYHKTTEINGFTVLQLLFEDVRLCQTILCVADLVKELLAQPHCRAKPTETVGVPIHTLT